MYADIFRGILIPFLGTALGAACVFFMKHTLSTGIQRALTGFAAGIMTA
ncbi:MAG TPA: ZIP zinc transporter, partial [Ruminococcus sp.]|nr:ZIP zinc transporter [Ruminococcus sp.]